MSALKRNRLALAIGLVVMVAAHAALAQDGRALPETAKVEARVLSKTDKTYVESSTKACLAKLLGHPQSATVDPEIFNRYCVCSAVKSLPPNTSDLGAMAAYLVDMQTEAGKAKMLALAVPCLERLKIEFEAGKRKKAP